METPKSVYQKKISPELMKELGISNVMAVPKLVKIVVNCGIGEALGDKKVLESMSVQLSAITGQKAKTVKAKKAISSFKLREGDVIGLTITLRGQRMYAFLKKFTDIALPRVRDFRGIPRKGFDGRGNYTMGLKEQNIFPELEYRLIDKPRGFELTFVTTARTDAHALALLTKLGMPFEKES